MAVLFYLFIRTHYRNWNNLITRIQKQKICIVLVEEQNYTVSNEISKIQWLKFIADRDDGEQVRSVVRTEICSNYFRGVPPVEIQGSIWEEQGKLALISQECGEINILLTWPDDQLIFTSRLIILVNICQIIMSTDFQNYFNL